MILWTANLVAIQSVSQAGLYKQSLWLAPELKEANQMHRLQTVCE
jgi:hypothetical protein